MMALISRAYALLSAWSLQAESSWYDLPEKPGLGCYGSGYNAWGVQTNQKYFAALTALTLAPLDEAAVTVDRAWALERALAALRFSLDSHVSGSLACTDGSAWGHTWISGLGIERMMHAVARIEPLLSEADRAGLRRVLVSEAEWLLTEYKRAGLNGVAGDRWNSSGKNQPESNLWNGAILWRAAVLYPDHPHAADWQERAHQFLVNAASVPADAENESILAGKPVRERFVGANFFPSYALDHHGYLNIGYMTICVSNAAMLHFDLRMKGLPRPETLDHHQADLWQALRRFIFSNGRLARIGGDSRVRYAYCQEYLLPALLYAADHLGDPQALDLLARQVELIETEAGWTGDGSFYGSRLAPLAQASLFYTTRLESDRAVALAQLIAYAPLLKQPLPAAASNDQTAAFEASVAGSWTEPEHAAALVRSPRRLASFAWRAYGLAQGMCQPPEEGHLTDWEYNLGGRVEFIHHLNPFHPKPPVERRLLDAHVTSFEGGFLTWGSLVEGAEIELAEGWRGTDMAVHQVVFAALPDDQTVLGLEYCRLNGARGLLRQVKGLHLNLANDLYNGFSRTVSTPAGEMALQSPPAQDQVFAMGSTWACIENKLGVIGLYGADELVVSRSAQRRGGTFQSLFVDEFCFPYLPGPLWVDAGAVVLDCGWAVLSGADAARTGQAAGEFQRLPAAGDAVRLVTYRGANRTQYLLAANFGPESFSGLPKTFSGRRLVDLSTGQPAADLHLSAGQARLYQVL